jgi:anti-anti-sigma factor
MEKHVLPEPEGPEGDVRVTWAHPPQHLLPPCLRVETHPDGDRVAVVVSGEVDIDTEEVLHEALREALRRSVSGVDVDLGGVDFCDCSGLNVLLCARRRALEDAKTVVLSSTGPAVGRLLSLTGTRGLFGGPDTTAATMANDHGEDFPDGGSRVDERERPDGSEGDPKSMATDREPDLMAPDRDPNRMAAPDREPDPPAADRDLKPIATDRDLDTEADQDLHIELVQLRRALQTRPVIDLARGVLMASFALSPQDAWNVLVTVSQKTNTKLHHVAEDLVAAVNGDAPPGPLRQELAAAVTAVKEPTGAHPGGA